MSNEEYIISEDFEIVQSEEYKRKIKDYFEEIPVVAESLLNNAQMSFNKIEKMLYETPAFINIVQASISEDLFRVVLNEEQKRKLANGSLKLLTKKDGTLLAELINPETGKIVSKISLDKIDLTPEVTNAMSNYAMQMQMAQIAEQIQVVQIAIEEVRQGQEFDRLATAYSCQQKLLQAMSLSNPDTKVNALLRIANDAEDSRNLLMQSQNINLEFIKSQPESFFAKIINGANQETIDKRINELRESLNVINMVSLVEAMAYQEMNEKDAARHSLLYYAEFLEKAYLNTKGLVERLDSMDSSPENYWSKNLPEIKKKIVELPILNNSLLNKGDNRDEEGM